METMIPADDPVRLLNAFVEGMDLSELYHTYDRIRKKRLPIQGKMQKSGQMAGFSAFIQFSSCRPKARNV